MKLTVVNCGDPREYAVVKYQPLAPAYISAYTPSHWDRELVDENFQSFDPRACTADLVAFSALPRHVHRAYAHAATLRKMGVPTVAGGLHVSAMPQEALEHFDAIVEGEAEPVWQELLRDFEAGRLQRHYISNFDHSLRDLRVPDRRFIHRGYKIASLSTSRCCPNSCSFCYMGSLARKTYRVIPNEAILRDLAQVPQKMMVLSDANFLGHTEEHYESRRELCRMIIRSGIKKYWAAQITADVMDVPELPELLYRAGCRMAFIGFETIGQDGLGSISKSQNLRADYTKVVQRLQGLGIAVAASFILGLDTHDLEYQGVLESWLDEARPLFLNLGVLTPMPNTRLYKDMNQQGRLLCDGLPLWDHMDKATNTIRYSKLTPAQVEQMFQHVVAHFFRKRNIARNFLHQLLVRRRPSLSLLYLVSALKKRENTCRTAVPGSSRSYRAAQHPAPPVAK